MASWKCPKCCTENNVKYLQCSCGYEFAEVSELAKKINPVVAGHLRNAVMIILESKDKVPNWNMYSLAKRSVLFKNLSKSVLSVIAAILNGENPQNIADKYVSERKEAHTHNSRARRSSAPVEDYMLEDNYDEESFP